MKKTIISNLIRQTEQTRDRATKLGDRLVALGQTDMNRGQFLAVVNQAINQAKELINGALN